jgi:hypothetical protein
LGRQPEQLRKSIGKGGYARAALRFGQLITIKSSTSIASSAATKPVTMQNVNDGTFIVGPLLLAGAAR